LLSDVEETPDVEETVGSRRKPAKKQKPKPVNDGVMTWGLLEQILRHYYEFRSLYEREGIEEICIRGNIVNVHDLLRGIKDLPLRQRQAVVYMCIENLREVDAAQIMLPESKWSSPVGVYKRTGLAKLVKMYYSSEAED
jgi:hypothetical protein